MKKFYCFILTIIIICTISVISFADEEEIIVFITRTGDRYHIESCRYARNSTSIILTEAISNGYIPCITCSPPTIEELIIPNIEVVPEQL